MASLTFEAIRTDEMPWYGPSFGEEPEATGNQTWLEKIQFISIYRSLMITIYFIIHGWKIIDV